MDIAEAKIKAIDFLSKGIILSECSPNSINPYELSLYPPEDHYFFTFNFSVEPLRLGGSHTIAVSKKDGSVNYLVMIGE